MGLELNGTLYYAPKGSNAFEKLETLATNAEFTIDEPKQWVKPEPLELSFEIADDKKLRKLFVHQYPRKMKKAQRKLAFIIEVVDGKMRVVGVQWNGRITKWKRKLVNHVQRAYRNVEIAHEGSTSLTN